MEGKTYYLFEGSRYRYKTDMHDHFESQASCLSVDHVYTPIFCKIFTVLITDSILLHTAIKDS